MDISVWSDVGVDTALGDIDRCYSEQIKSRWNGVRSRVSEKSKEWSGSEAQTSKSVCGRKIADKECGFEVALIRTRGTDTQLDREVAQDVVAQQSNRVHVPDQRGQESLPQEVGADAKSGECHRQMKSEE